MSGAADGVRPLSLLIAALGGEGGGVLSNWIVDAAEHARLPVQGTSIPGVAQRTGATTYYLEIWPEPWSELAGRVPVLALSAVPGEVDVVAASELLEAGRAISQGFVTPDRTCLVTSTHRVFTTHEKMVEDDGRHDAGALREVAARRAAVVVSFDMEKTAAEADAPLSAVLLGAIAGAGGLPLTPADFRAAIERQGKAVAANLRGFEAGLAGADGSEAPAGPGAPAGDRGMDLLREAKAALPAEVHETLDHAVPRLVDYQDRRHAADYIERLVALRDLPPGLLNAVARRLAVRMTYEDVIRVAQAKLRRSRMDRIRAETGAEAGEPVYVTDLFKPGIAEIADLLPAAWGERLMARAGRDAQLAAWSWTLSLRTDRFGGALRLWLLANLRRWRRRTYRYRREQAAIDQWLDDIARAAEVDPALALELADGAGVIKGYGDTHRRGTAEFNRRRDAVVARSR